MAAPRPAAAERVRELGPAGAALAGGRLSPDELELVLFAVCRHSLHGDTSRQAAAAFDAGLDDGRSRDEGEGRAAAALRLLWVLKDADALDRVRLGDLDLRYLRHPCALDLVAFAHELYAELPD